ncbi:hypothetical protein GLIP_3208 [Aliiglaciecola lipolytica E3]|uniref:Uncharacterized protein n=1 Tax=Aliiglaciecola lipolytica E3 TaxID=1127673 RepID=K6YX75_9ALTE|nr:hypothetical protein GLIP_3208 [Aliiglaciecola lipolytica E3]
MQNNNADVSKLRVPQLTTLVIYHCYSIISKLRVPQLT